MLKNKEKIRILILSVFALAVCLSYVLLFFNYKSRMERLGEDARNEFSSAVKATAEVYGLLAEMIFEETAHRPEIRELFFKAQNLSDPLEKAYIRGVLHKRMEPAFARAAYYQIRLLNLIQPDGTVFLRMHAPDQFGDNVLSYSSLQEAALKKRIPLQGFQVDRILSLYRYSFPLFFGNSFLGSAEYGLSLSAFVQQLKRQFPGHYFLLLRREALRTLNPGELEKQYTPSSFSTEFMEEVRFLTIEDPFDRIDPDLVGLLMKRAAERLKAPSSQLFQGSGFTLLLREGRTVYTLSFLPLKDPRGCCLGYLAGMAQNPAAEEIEDLYILFAILLALFFLASGLLLPQALRSHSRLVDEATFDSLTGALKRSEFEPAAQTEVSRARRYRHPLSVIMFDLDDFKSINDRYGHLAGDRALRSLGHTITSSVRKADCFFRWGGDEFLLVLPNTGKDGARKLAEKLRRLASEVRIEDLQGLSLSLGIAQLDENDPDLSSVVKRADEALYRAKQLGKNRISD